MLMLLNHTVTNRFCNMHECNVANTFIQESPRRESSPWYDDAQAKHHRVRASYILLVVRGVIRHSRDLWSILLEPPGRLIIEQNCALQSYCVFFKLPCFTTRERSLGQGNVFTGVYLSTGGLPTGSIHPRRLVPFDVIFVFSL